MRMKRKKNSDWILIVEKARTKRVILSIFLIGLFAIILLLFFLAFMPTRVDGGFSCSVNNIEYVNLSEVAPGTSCWLDDVDESYCPVPHDISCSGNIGLPVSLSDLLFLLNEN